MDNQVDFGKCLNELLLVRGWSAARLSREINIDSSYVRRWIRGERIPSIKSDYIEQIADSLSSGLELPSKKTLCDMFIRSLRALGFSCNDSQPLRENIIEALSFSQIYSLKLTPDERMMKYKNSEHYVQNLLKNLKPADNRKLVSFPHGNSILNFNDIPPLIKGREGILNSMISLINEGAARKTPSKGEIIMTFQSENEAFDSYPELYEQWQNKLTMCLKQGWNIYHLWRLNKNINRSFMLVEKIVGLLGYKGKYQPLYFSKYGTTNPPYEIMVVDNIGAMICFASDNTEYVDTAFFYNQPEAVKSLGSYLKQLSVETDPVLKVFTLNEYFEVTTEKDKRPGDRFVFGMDLDSLTLPAYLWEKHLLRTIGDKDEVAVHMKRINARINSMEEQVQKYKFRNIFQLKALEHLFSTGKYYIPSIYRKPTPDEVIAHIKHVIYLLETYDNLEIGFLDDNQVKALPQVYWEVKGDHTAIIDVWYPFDVAQEKDEPGLFVAITEGTIAGSFKDYFLDLWEKITPKYKDKKYIISWLNERLEWFSSRYK